MNALNRKVWYYLIILFAIGAACGFGVCYAVITPKAERAITERDRFIDEYRRSDAEAARTHQRIVERNRRLQEGLGGIRELAAGSIKDIRSAVNILAGVKSILEAMEENGDLRDTGGDSSGDYKRGLN